MKEMPSSEQEFMENTSPIPIEGRTAGEILAEISLDPLNMLDQVSLDMENNNPLISAHIAVNLQTFNLSNQYIEGAVWTYATLANQAKKRGGEVPFITESSILAYDRSRLEEAMTKDKNFNREKRTKELELELRKDERELFFAISRISQYSPRRYEYFRGTADVYYLIRGKLEADALERKFSI